MANYPGIVGFLPSWNPKIWFIDKYATIVNNDIKFHNNDKTRVAIAFIEKACNMPPHDFDASVRNKYTKKIGPISLIFHNKKLINICTGNNDEKREEILELIYVMKRINDSMKVFL